MKEQEILKLFEETGALLKGHFMLSSGLHSGNYFQCALLLQYPDIAEELCGELADYFIITNIAARTKNRSAVESLTTPKRFCMNLDKAFEVAPKRTRINTITRGIINDRL